MRGHFSGHPMGRFGVRRFPRRGFGHRPPMGWFGFRPRICHRPGCGCGCLPILLLGGFALIVCAIFALFAIGGMFFW